MADRFPFAPLERLVDRERRGDDYLAARFDVSRYTLGNWRREGLSRDHADRMAYRAGYHPGEVWERWWDEAEATFDLLRVEHARAVSAERERARKRARRQAAARANQQAEGAA